MITAVVLVSPVALRGEGELAPEPAEPEQREAEKRIREVYGADYAQRTPERMRALAAKLLRRSVEGTKSPTTAYVLLREARDLAARAGDPTTALGAVDELAKRFRIDAGAMKRSALATAARSARTPADSRKVAHAYIGLADEAVVADDHGSAKEMLTAARAPSRRARDPALTAELRDLFDDLAELNRSYGNIQPGLEAITKRADDPDANLAVGKFLCLYKGDWRKGLPMLAKGSDGALSALARDDLARPPDSSAQAALGQRWWKLAETSERAERVSLQGRGGRWHAQAVSGLSGLERDIILKPLEALASEGPFPRSFWPRMERGCGFVMALFNGQDLRGWEPLSGTWRTAAGQILSAGRENRFIRSRAAAHWVEITFEFRGGNPGLYLSSSRDATGGPGVNLDSDAQYNGEIQRAVDMGRWNVVRMEFHEKGVRVFLNDMEVYKTYVTPPAYVLVKAERGELSVRKLVAIGFNP